MTYLLTFSCYGTWLHGDGRGSIDRHQCMPNSPVIQPSPSWETYERGLLKEEPCSLEPAWRDIAMRTIVQVCDFRQWTLYALHVRTKHIHVVADVPCAPERAITDFKAYITRRVREAGHDGGRQHFWSRYGSTVRLGDHQAVENAVVYVLEKQGEPMATYLNPNWSR